jgi:hypothetical protein
VYLQQGFAVSALFFFTMPFREARNIMVPRYRRPVRIFELVVCVSFPGFSRRVRAITLIGWNGVCLWHPD